MVGDGGSASSCVCCVRRLRCVACARPLFSPYTNISINFDTHPFIKEFISLHLFNTITLADQKNTNKERETGGIDKEGGLIDEVVEVADLAKEGLDEWGEGRGGLVHSKRICHSKGDTYLLEQSFHVSLTSKSSEERRRRREEGKREGRRGEESGYPYSRSTDRWACTAWWPCNSLLDWGLGHSLYINFK